MKPFTYVRASTAADAISTAERERNAKYLGGGTNLWI